MFAALLVLSAPGPARAGEQEIVLRDHIKLEWRNELVSYPFEAERGVCHPESVTLAGPRGPMPVQLWEVVRWPGTEWVKSAKLSFIVDRLAPLGTNTYTVRYGREPSKATTPPADLKVARGEGFVEIATSRFGVRLMVGEKTYAEPASASEVPGPLLEMRLADGTWFGGSRMYGKSAIKSYSARLTADGPVFAEVSYRYAYADGNVMELVAHVTAGDSAMLWDARVKEDRPDDGWCLVVSRGLPPLTWRAVIEGNSKLAPRLKRKVKVNDWVDVPLDSHPAGVVTNLSPWHNWWDEYTETIIRLKIDGTDRELRISRRDAGVWVEPSPPGTMKSGPGLRPKLLPLMRSEDGEVYLRVNNAGGQRKWALGVHPIPDREDPDFCYLGRYKVIRHGHIGRHLDQVKDWVLDWEVKTEHPHLYLNRKQLQEIQQQTPDSERIEEMLELTGTDPQVRSSYRTSLGVGAYLLTGRKDVAERALLVERLDWLLAKLGHLDTWRVNGMVCSLYDAVMGGDLLSPQKQKLFQARLAYLGYRSADPATWSAERGYCSGNLNMTVCNNLLLGILACTIPDHPMARQWCQRAMTMMENMLSEKVGPAGEWPESVAHYAHVSATPLLIFAIAARNAGLADFINDERMKRLQMFLAKQYTPPDPRHTEQDKGGKVGLLPPVGRGPAGEAFGLAGAMARATAQSDPAYSRILQWVWLRTRQPRRLTGDHMIGWEYVCMDPALPAEKPDWGLDFFPRTGAIMRHGVGTPNEWYVYLICEHTYTVPTESGTLPAVFARGVPISSRFACSYPDREELLLNRVLLARPRGDLSYRIQHYGHEAKRQITDVSALPGQQYLAGDFTIEKEAPRDLGTPKPNSYTEFRILPEWPPVPQEGKPNVNWRRQVLFVHADDPAGVGYLVLRDTVRGGQPTMWQFWTVSEKIGTPRQAADREQFLADAPGNNTLEPRQLPQSNRYTALGQFDVDVEFYIAEPKDTPRHTLRFGLTHAYVSLSGYSEYQDLLHLQRPDDGAYYVVIFPRKRHEPAPEFATLAEGKIIKVFGHFGTDYAFLSAEPILAAAGDVAFEGTAGSVQNRPHDLVLSLGAAGKVEYRGISLACKGAASLRLDRKTHAEITLPPAHTGLVVDINLPGQYRLADETTASVQLTERETTGTYTLTVEAGTEHITLLPY